MAPAEPAQLSPADTLCILQRFLRLPSCLDPLQADAGAPQFVTPNPATGDFAAVTLNGSRSVSRQGGAFTLQWDVTGVPDHSDITSASLSAGRSAMPQFTPDVIGFYTLQLTVTDTLATTAQDTVVVNAQAPENLTGSCRCEGHASTAVDLSILVTDAAEAGVPTWPVTFTAVVGTGTFVQGQRARPRLAGRTITPLTTALEPGCRPTGRDLSGRLTTVECLTDAAGMTTASWQLGAGVHLIVARASGVETPFYFCPGLDDRDGDCVADAVEVELELDPDRPDSNGNGLVDGLEDTDRDGLANVSELIVGTHPALSDTDADGIPDGAADADFDHLTNGQEINRFGTNPGQPDTDGDGIADGDEVVLGTNPHNAAVQAVLRVRLQAAPVGYFNHAFQVLDSDGDRVADGDETLLGTDPANPDDRPLLAIRLHSAPVAYSNEALQAQDRDGDGVADRDEIALGTDPENRDDRPPIRLRPFAAPVIYRNALP